MKYIILISVLLFALLNINAQYSREEAIEIVKENMIAPDSLTEVELYSKYDKVIQGDTIFLEYLNGYYINPFEEAWVFFIDDMPTFMWGHNCRFVFFDAFSGEYIIHQELTPPLPYFEDLRLFWNQWEWVIYNELTREEAINIVINEIIEPGSLDNKQLFSRYEEFMYNDTLWMFQHEYYHLFNHYKAWAFFIDDMPLAYWAHPCRVVFVFVYAGYTYVTEDEWPPDPYLEDWDLFLEQWQWITTVDIPENDLSLVESKLFPNPCKDELSFQYNLDPNLKLDFFISDIGGKTIDSFSWEYQSGQLNFNTSQLSNGLYIINVSENGKPIIQEKFMRIE